MTTNTLARQAQEAGLVPAAESRLYESLALKGDISGLGPQERVMYYARLCQRLGLDPYTQPFTPLKLNGKEILYASKGATDQLAAKHNVTREITGRERVADVYVVTARASMPSGRFDDATGVVPLGRLQGEALANALMKAETKAKRRATLSLLGLGMLDETELDTIPAERMQHGTPAIGAGLEGAPAEVVDTATGEVLDGLLEPFCPTCAGPMYDNRDGKRNPKAPDYKCKTKGCDGVYWPGQWPPKAPATTEERETLTRLVAEFVSPDFTLDEKQSKAVKKAAMLVDAELASGEQVQQAIKYLAELLDIKRPFEPGALDLPFGDDAA